MRYLGKNRIAKKEWIKATSEEIAFWEKWISTQRDKWKEVYKRRIDPESIVMWRAENEKRQMPTIRFPASLNRN